MAFTKYNIEQAIRHLQEKLNDDLDMNALNVLIWNYRAADESNRLLSKTLKELQNDKSNA